MTNKKDLLSKYLCGEIDRAEFDAGLRATTLATALRLAPTHRYQLRVPENPKYNGRYTKDEIKELGFNTIFIEFTDNPDPTAPCLDEHALDAAMEKYDAVHGDAFAHTMTGTGNHKPDK